MGTNAKNGARMHSGGFLRRGIRVAGGELKESAARQHEWIRAESFRAGIVFSCLSGPERLRRRPQFLKTTPGDRACHLVVWRKPDDYKFRDKRDAELGDQRGDDDRYHAGKLYFDFGERVDKR